MASATATATTTTPPWSLEISAFPAHPAPPPGLRGARGPDAEPVTPRETERALRAAATDETERLGDEIAELAAHLHAATYRLLVLLAEFDRRGGWWTGFRTCAEWLSWRTGIGPGAAREKVRVARALPDLPLLSGAMAAGELSYSKLRALTRVATPVNEGELLGYARAGTAAHVERLVRAWRRVDRWEEAEAEELRHQARHLSVYPDDDGMMVVRGRVDPEVGAVLRRALEAAEDALYRKRTWEVKEEEAKEEEAPEPEKPTAGQRRADALGLLAEAALGRGLGAALREEEAGDKAEAGDGAEAAPHPRPRVSGLRAERYQVVLHVDADTLAADGATARGVLDHDVGVSAETCRRLSCDAGLVTMLHGADHSPDHPASRGGAPSGARSILDVGRKTRTIPPAIRRALDARDRGCVFPGCLGLSFTSAHHVIHWADGGPTSLENLLLLCRFHHRVVHEGGWRVEFTPGEKPRFHRPEGGGLLPEVPTPLPLPPDPVATLQCQHRDRGVEPDPWTPTPSWNGERLDLGLAVSLFREWTAAREREARVREEGPAGTEQANGETARPPADVDVSAETRLPGTGLIEAWYGETSPGTPMELLDIYG